MEHEDQVLEYKKPAVVDYGDLAELTAGNVDGSTLDADFPEGTPKEFLRFS